MGTLAPPPGSAWNVGSPVGARRPPFLTPDRVQLRYSTLLDAFHTADRRQRGYLPYDRVLEIYSLYFNASIGVLNDEELASFTSKYTSHSPADGSLVIEYAKFADAIRKRDLDMMNKAEARSMRQGRATPFSGEQQDGAAPSPSRDVGRRIPFATHEDVPSTPPSRRVRSGMYADVEARGGRPPIGKVAGKGATPDDTPGLPGLPGLAGRSPLAVRVGGTAAPPNWLHSPSQARGDTGALQHETPSHEMSSGALSALGEPEVRVAQSSVPSGGLDELLRALQAADTDGSGRLHGAQVLTLCRMHGVQEPSALLHAILRDVAGPDGRTDYIGFVQQLAAQRTGAAAQSVAASVHSVG